MTEDQYQAARKVLQTANWMRGEITTAKGEVAKWTKIEASFRENLQPTRADGAKKMLDKAMEMLHAARKRFADLKLPDEDVKEGVKWGRLIMKNWKWLTKTSNSMPPEQSKEFQRSNIR